MTEGRRRGGALGASEASSPRFPNPGLQILLQVPRPRGVGEMAARSVGSGVGRLRSLLQARAGAPGRRLGGGSARRGAASLPRGSALAAAAQPASYPAQRLLAAQQPAAFWGPLAQDTLVWDTPYHTVWDCDLRSGKIGWFLGGQLNVSGEWAAGALGVPSSSVQRPLSEPSQGQVAGGCAVTSRLRGPSLPVRCTPAS